MAQSNAVEMKGITKTFGRVNANHDVDFVLKKGEILSVLGENGSGKTTLMNILSGVYFPDEGEIYVNGEEVSICSPKDALDLGIGMVHQHFKLVDVLSATENIILGLEGKTRLNLKSVRETVVSLINSYGFELDPDKKIYEMSVSEKQTVEIVKMLYRGADILILDEPTAVLTPQETNKLFEVLRNMRSDGKSIIIITHKLNEVMEISDRVTVLRKGEQVGEVMTAESSIEQLTELMVGEKVNLDIDRKDPVNPQKRLAISHLTVNGPEGVKSVKDANFEVYSGEILGVAGIAGSGQKELLEAIAGLKKISEGNISYFSPEGLEEDLTQMNPAQIQERKICFSFVPEDRLGMGLVASMDLPANMMVRLLKTDHAMFPDRKEPERMADEIIRQLDVSTPGLNVPIRQLSGGNVQKLLVGREISMDPNVLMVAYPVRGLDIQSSYTIYHLLNEQKENGVAVICIIEDLDVLLELCDRIIVLCDGEIAGTLDARNATKEQIGLLMTGQTEDQKDE